ncbi:electron transfer flavoprotein subunit alpha/FixB family protein [Caldisericum exile]|uniref:Electron transfer flavoprotein alpha-subunit n=1 Tax=Caldisericum exile (strain DSM 21853 / NBRC 104410 / AZM16c01) TaxID=511051 RepID=A0A7U6GEL6_CALEA|nr:FAD-binding protein [Caldisericum exile]BAL80978.1 electron transfer flavoprotein alpha-subunit [Caldisericum exile AZM16c01]
MKALIVYETNLPNLNDLHNIFDNIRIASVRNDRDADYIPSFLIRVSSEGLEFLSKIEEINDFDVIIFSNEVLPREIASLFAGKNGFGIVSHVSEIRAEKNNLSFIVYGWKNLGVEIISKTKPTVCIINNGVYKDKYNPLNREIIEISKDQSVEIVESFPQSIDEKIKSKIVIGVGLGVSKDLYQQIFFIAEKIGAKVVCTRPVADLGYFPYDSVVGDTGIEIETDIYIALGISGSIQHLSGISAKTIIAVNSDSNAPIFSKAHIKVNENVEKVVGGLFEWVKGF